MSFRNSFGTAGFEGKNRYIKDIKLKAPKQGESVTHLVGRIVPPMKSLQNDPDGWSQFTKYHYGHVGAGRQPGKTVPRTFACIEQVEWGQNKEKKILVRCPKCDEINGHRAAEKNIEKQIEAAGGKGRNPVLDQALQAEKDWLFANSLSMGYKMYIVTPTDEIFRLQLSGKAKKALQGFLNDLKTKKGVQALDIDEGVYIDFMRTGFGRDTQDTFAVATTTKDIPNVGKVELPMKAPLTDAILERLVKDCPDLATTATMLSAEQIQMLVDSDGSPAETDRIFALSAGAPAAAASRDEEYEEEEYTPPATSSTTITSGSPHSGGATLSAAGTLNITTTTNASVPTPAVTPAAPALDLQALMAANPALAAQIAALTGQPAAPANDAPKTQLTDDEFFKLYATKQ